MITSWTVTSNDVPSIQMYPNYWQYVLFYVFLFLVLPKNANTVPDSNIRRTYILYVIKMKHPVKHTGLKNLGNLTLLEIADADVDNSLYYNITTPRMRRLTDLSVKWIWIGWNYGANDSTVYQVWNYWTRDVVDVTTLRCYNVVVALLLSQNLSTKMWTTPIFYLKSVYQKCPENRCYTNWPLTIANLIVSKL